MLNQEIDIDTLLHMIREQQRQIEDLKEVVVYLDDEVEKLWRRSCPCEMRYA